jgi:hypothetical protein
VRGLQHLPLFLFAVSSIVAAQDGLPQTGPDISFEATAVSQYLWGDSWQMNRLRCSPLSLSPGEASP